MIIYITTVKVRYYLPHSKVQRRVFTIQQKRTVHVGCNGRIYQFQRKVRSCDIIFIVLMTSTDSSGANSSFSDKRLFYIKAQVSIFNKQEIFKLETVASSVLIDDINNNSSFSSPLMEYNYNKYLIIITRLPLLLVPILSSDSDSIPVFHSIFEQNHHAILRIVYEDGETLQQQRTIGYFYLSHQQNIISSTQAKSLPSPTLLSFPSYTLPCGEAAVVANCHQEASFISNRLVPFDPLHTTGRSSTRKRDEDAEGRLFFNDAMVR